MARLFFNGDLELLRGKVVAVIGYGNQGRAQALNMRDSGVSVIIGNIRDAYWEAARRDGFEVYDIDEAVERADIVLLLIPDEVMPNVYSEKVLPRLRDGMVLAFASGYNVAFGFITPRQGVDYILVAPRMIGQGVRNSYLEGRGFPVLIGVAQDSSGRALDYALAIAKAIGAFGAGGCAVESSFEEEAHTDLFGEQVIGGGMLFLIRTAYEVMVEYGISPEVALLELYASGELIEVFKAVFSMGLWGQLKLHSTTSQYGQQTRGPRIAGPELKTVLRGIMEDIVSGRFAREWALEQMAGKPHFKAIWRRNLRHPMILEEQKLYRALGRIKD